MYTAEAHDVAQCSDPHPGFFASQEGVPNPLNAFTIGLPINRIINFTSTNSYTYMSLAEGHTGTGRSGGPGTGGPGTGGPGTGGPGTGGPGTGGPGTGGPVTGEPGTGGPGTGGPGTGGPGTGGPGTGGTGTGGTGTGSTGVTMTMARTRLAGLKLNRRNNFRNVRASVVAGARSLLRNIQPLPGKNGYVSDTLEFDGLGIS